MTKKTNMKANTIFREIDEMLAGVHGYLTDGEIIDRVAALAAGDPETPPAAWLIHHARWHRERTVGGTVTRAEATARGMRPARLGLVVQADGTVVLHTRTDGFPTVLRPPEVRDEVVDMADVERLDGQHPGKRLVELVKAALAEQSCAAA
jgi:hypothetical protein